MTTLIETFARVDPDTVVGRALRHRSEILRLSEAAHDAVLLPRNPGGLSHVLRAALAARMARQLGDADSAAHYEAYVGYLGGGEAEEIMQPGSCADDPRIEAILHHVDMLTLKPREATRGSVGTLKAAGLVDADIVRLCELAAFVNYQVRVVAGLKLLGNAQ